MCRQKSSINSHTSLHRTPRKADRTLAYWRNAVVRMSPNQRVEDMHCSHCEAAVVRAVENLPGVEKAKASASANTLTIKGPATEGSIRKAVEGIGYTFKGRSSESR